MSDSAERAYQTLCEHVGQIALLSSTEQLLGWDERTMLPPAGAEHRAEQMTLLAGMIHGQWTDPELGQWLAELVESPLAADEASDTGATIRRVKRQYDRCVKLPQSLVEELTRVSVLGQQAWQKARADDDYAAFQPWLEKTIALKRQEAQSLGYPERPYDALLDEYEPDERTSTVAATLSQLREQLVPLVGEIRQCGRKPDATILQQSFPVGEQESFAREAAARIGFDFNRGRLDVTAHPFCCSPGPNDCRITSRYNERAFGDAFFSVLHEAGHGMYEQGLPADQYGLPLGEAVSLGIHESQSRLWENMVGRSRPFWEHFFPEAQRRFPDALGHVSLDDFHFAVNDVRPSLIRVEADEATYNLHILIRFELEQALLDDDLSTDDLPGAWNDSYARYLGVRPSDDADGVLQDIHWAGGAVGYFPTYSLGNLYAAQLYAQAEADLGGLDGQFAQGEFRPLLEWLRENVHQHGQRYSAAELVRRVTGKPLSHVPLIEHLRAKLGPLYHLA
ncbi:MAG: carboxypeptidase M32 [Planctomycetes bacterium]|nr:carboxypeptidase M32 [Planctomycetota bacterium]